MKLNRAFVLPIGCSAALASAFTAHADSFVTSMPFFQAYEDVEWVSQAQQGTLTAELAQVLNSDKATDDEAAAIINALGWDIDGKKNASLFLSEVFGADREGNGLPDLNPRQSFVYGYLKLMDNYFAPEKALPLLLEAHLAQPENQTYAMILSLAHAQWYQHEGAWCTAWKTMFRTASEPKLTAASLRKDAMKTIMDYAGLYEESCVP